jgi:hypothetical protein
MFDTSANLTSTLRRNTYWVVRLGSVTVMLDVGFAP